LTDKVATRLYIRAVLAEGGVAEIDAAQAHRLRHVLRLGPSEAIAAFNERDGEFLCRITELGRSRGLLTVEKRLRAPEAEADLWLLFAPIKRLRLDWLIEKGTELGVSVFVPVMTERTQPERLNRERLAGHAVAAAEQSERLSVPEIRKAERLSQALDRWDAARLLIVCDETGGGEPIGEALHKLKPAPVALLTGPEGGFTQSELDALADLPFVSRVGLGPRVLRAETAVLAALAAYQAIAGDGRRARSR
jgi:16S rRNA (uracil1498-N3)-methyltransferase